MNQNPEQLARDRIDEQLTACGWTIQNKSSINLHAGIGVAVREYQTDIGPADYVLFVDKKPVGLIEAKRKEEGVHLTVHEEQSQAYAESKLKYLNNDPLPFVYESTGEVTRFTDYRDPKPRSRNIFTFHRPETFRDWLKEEKTLRGRLHDLPQLAPFPNPVPNVPLPPTGEASAHKATGLRDCQFVAITNLERSFKAAKPKALIQMATGSGKTFTAISFIYRLLKFAKAKRILFLVDTKNLGEQAEQEFMSFLPNDDNRKFTELYGVHRLKSAYIPTDNQVYISTIQRMYSVLKGEELDESSEEENPAERKWLPKEPVPVEYNEKLPIEAFDFIIIDECHRSIYNLWKQVLDYFDAFLIGLTATPDNRTFGFFDQNIVSDYGFEKAVTDGVLVGYDTFTIETEITKNGSRVKMGEYVDRRERLTRKKFWQQLDEDVEYSAKRLDDDVVNPNQIRLIIKTFKENLPKLFPDRWSPYQTSPNVGGLANTQPLLSQDSNNMSASSTSEVSADDLPPLGEPEGAFEVPKTLIFAKTDSHADDIINIVREEFGEENRFCKKITYRAEEDPKSVLAQFRNNYHPRIAVTVDMIATGTDVRPLECLLFMRDVKSRNYFEQMKGRGTRTISLDDLRKVTPSARQVKDHFVIVDAVGVTKSLKTDSRPLERKPGVPLKDLLYAVAVGNKDEDLFTSLANRLTRLDKQITEKERKTFEEKAGRSITRVIAGLLNAYNPDTIESIKRKVEHENLGASPETLNSRFTIDHSRILDEASKPFTGELNTFIENVRKAHEQIIDHINQDKLINAGWDADNKENAAQLIADFKQWIEEHKNEITALQIFYSQPYARRELTYTMIKELFDILTGDKPMLAPMRVWHAYEQPTLRHAQGDKLNGSPKKDLVALVSLIRHVCGIDAALMPYDKTVDRNFQQWILKKNAGQHNRFTEEQMAWLRMIKEHIASSFHLEREDLDYAPFDSKGGLGKMWQLFGEKTDEIINELNEELVA
ncbi:MAG: type I restriction endonuclease subunit R [Flavisolibacter sp.]